ncbi:unnamed protein product [Calicophoron daubneyi]|uniref:Deoxyhypusine hydroxylase n=1 Tax=Calicophoron daubneyi TaxID=300641 RepID=A0AAV2T8A0_CALDB
MGKLPVPEDQLRAWAQCLMDPSAKLVDRARSLWGLRHAGEKLAVSLIAGFLNDVVEPSPVSNVLLQHEAAYCLGQRGDCEAVPCLIQVMRDARHHPVVRHEAGEALAALCGCSGVDLNKIEQALKEFVDCDVVELSDTCKVGLGRLQWVRENLGALPIDDIAHRFFPDTTDPAPSLEPASRPPCDKLRDMMMDPKLPLYTRYRALFSIRDCVLEGELHHPTNPEAFNKPAGMLAEGLAAPGSALLRHEVAYVLGQLTIKDTVPQLERCLRLTTEHPMVRHEAAEALGAVLGEIEAHAHESPEQNDEKIIEMAQNVLRDYLGDKEAVVRESCVLALDMADYVSSSEQFQYAAVPS